MLITRIITAVVLLVVLLAVLFSGYYPAFVAVVLLFLMAAVTECFQLFGRTRMQAALVAVFWVAAFAYAFLYSETTVVKFWFALASGIWLLRFVPSLATGLPPIDSLRSTVLGMLYAVTIIACFAAIVVLFKQ